MRYSNITIKMIKNSKLLTDNEKKDILNGSADLIEKLGLRAQTLPIAKDIYRFKLNNNEDLFWQIIENRFKENELYQRLVREYQNDYEQEFKKYKKMNQNRKSEENYEDAFQKYIQTTTNNDLTPETKDVFSYSFETKNMIENNKSLTKEEKEELLSGQDRIIELLGKKAYEKIPLREVYRYKKEQKENQFWEIIKEKVECDELYQRLIKDYDLIIDILNASYMKEGLTKKL